MSGDVKNVRNINNVFKQLRQVISDCYDFENDRLYHSYNLGDTYIRIKNSENIDRKEFLERLLQYLVNSDYLHGLTKIYLFNKHLNLDGVLNEYNKKYEEQFLKKSIGPRIWRDKEKFSNDIGKDVILDILYKNECDVDQYENNLYKLEIESTINNKKVFGIDNLIVTKLNGNKTIKNVNKTSITNDDFEEMLRLIYPYTNAGISEFNKNMDAKEGLLQYIAYLLSHDNLNQTDSERKKLLMKLTEKHD